jgi:hypothetical protein
VTIRPGASWGETVERPAGLRWFSDDATLAAHLALDREIPAAVTGGDLLRTLGGPSPDGRLRRYPIDVLHVAIDAAAAVPAVAHVVARAPGRLGWWRGPLWAACNVGHIGRWDVAPRAHPNDGQLDVVEVATDMTRRARLQAARRLPAGAHVPHPAIRIRRATTAVWAPGRPFAVFVDGVERRASHQVTVTIEPDGGLVHA